MDVKVCLNEQPPKKLTTVADMNIGDYAVGLGFVKGQSSYITEGTIVYLIEIDDQHHLLDLTALESPYDCDHQRESAVRILTTGEHWTTTIE